jgi:Protein phosphatase 2C
MAFRLLGHVWDPDTAANADFFHVADGTLLLLDGAAPPSTQRVSAFANDTVWLVRRFVEHCRALAESVPSMLDRIEAAREHAAEEYAGLCAVAGAVPGESPFSCLAVAHEAEGGTHFYNMGDCTTLIRDGSGSVHNFGQSAVRQLDREALDLLKLSIAQGIPTHQERSLRIGPRILSNRAQRNVLAGYDVLDVNVSSRGRIEVARYAPADVSAVLMMTDGFYRLVDTFARYTDASLLAAAEGRGLAPLLEELRELEVRDAECTAYPRFKPHDDATALWFSPSEP